MSFDDTLPPSRLPAFPELDQILAHFPAAFGVRVDVVGLDLLPALERQRYASARPPEPQEAVLLDWVLQLVPRRLLRGIERIILVPTRGTARPGGYLNGIVSVSAAEADVRRADGDCGNRFSVFATTVLHEIGHAAFETVLTADDQYEVLGSYARSEEGLLDRPHSEVKLLEEVQHHFIQFFLPALLGYGRPPYSAAASRRALAAFGLDLRQL
jgi:hypothetical protein